MHNYEHEETKSIHKYQPPRDKVKKAPTKAVTMKTLPRTRLDVPGERSFWNQLGPFIECGNNQLAKPYAAGPAQPGVLSACACLSKLGRMEEQGPIGARMTCKQPCATMDNFHGKNAQAQWRRHRAVTRPPTIASTRALRFCCEVSATGVA